MSVNSVLSKLGVGSRETVYMSVTPGVGLELIQLDMASKSVKNYAYRPLEYNESLREIPDMDLFKAAVQELFEELKISMKSNVILNLPLVLLGSKELPLIIGEDSITEALTSEVEQSYIFKRYDPVISWVDSNVTQSGDVRKFFYSAIQKHIIENINQVFESLGLTLAGIDVSLTSILKALAFSGVAADQMRDGVPWNLMIVNQNGYSICSLLGKNVIDYYEEPLAIKSFEGDEIYNAINASAQISLMSFPANYISIISETDLVSAELLASRLQFDGVVNYLENNDYKKQDIVPVNLEILEENAHKISLEAIGVAAGNAVDIPLKFNFVSGNAGDGVSLDPNEPIHVVLGGYEFEVSPNAARNVALVISFIILLPVLALMILFPMLAKQSQAKIDNLNMQIKTVEAQIDKFAGDENSQNFDVNNEIKRVLKNNRTKLMSYTAVGVSVPKKLWLTYFSAKDDGKIDIKGEAVNVEDVYVFYKNMKDYMIDTQLRLHKLELKSDSVDDAVMSDVVPSEYQFELTNMSEAELTPIVQEKNNEVPSGDSATAEVKGNGKKPNQLGSPLSDLGDDNGN